MTKESSVLLVTSREIMRVRARCMDDGSGEIER